jgi:hypothetical protein
VFFLETMPTVIVVEMPMLEDEEAEELLVEEPPLVSSKLSRQE